MVLCTHRDHIKITKLPERIDGCEECLAACQPWLHLRICLECGHVGCCDQSPHRHANAHANATGHPIIRSLEPGEEWAWCYIDRIGMLTPEVRGLPSTPRAPLLDTFPPVHTSSARRPSTNQCGNERESSRP